MNHVSSTVSVIKSTSFFTISGSSSSSGLETRLAAFKNASAWNVCTHSPAPKKLWNVRWDVKCFISSSGAYQLILWLTSFACDYELHNSHLQNEVYPSLTIKSQSKPFQPAEVLIKEQNKPVMVCEYRSTCRTLFLCTAKMFRDQTCQVVLIQNREWQSLSACVCCSSF